MKAPLSWLKEYVDIDCSAIELEKKLFSCGFEVEGVEHFGANINKIVTCKILSIEKHPNADKLSVTQVDAGKYGQLQIITAATNIFVGAIVPVAVDGATLFNGQTINNGELRGLPSYGMFCSGEELGINDDWYEGASVNGILILKEDYPLGEEVKDLLDISDVIFDINITANRPDCQSVLGLAREVAAVLGKELKMPDLSFECDNSVSTIETVSVCVKAHDLCPRYVSHLVKDIKITESPLWLKRRLFLMGIRSISNIVDITNYVLLEIGQPMHAFDLNDLSDNSIIVRRAEDGEKIITLDEKEFTLSKDNLVICDGKKPVALAGVMGGLNSEIKPTTKDVLFESASFKRDNVRKTSKQLGQRSDSSARFEKGVDFFSVETGMKRALNLIYKLGYGKIACDNYDLHEQKIENKIIKTTISKVNAVLGIEVPAVTIKDILERLSFGIEIKGDELIVNVPLYREDMESYPDIAEEIIREYGYDHIEPSLLKTSKITNGGLNEEQTKLNECKNLLVSYGFNEMISYSFVSEKDYDVFGIDKSLPEHKFVKLLNPLSEDVAIMRTTLLPSVVKACAYNINRQNLEGRLFELAKTYTLDETKKEYSVDKNVLCFATFGENEDFFTIKGVVEGLINNFCNGKIANYSRSTLAFMHPTRSADIYIDGNKIGYFGQLSPVVLQKIGVDKPLFACEINYDAFKKLFNDKIVFETISKFPSVERDIALIIDKKIECQSIINAIKSTNYPYLKNVSLFDIYEGDQIEQGKKSMAFNLLFVSTEKTLNVEEVDKAMNDILSALEEKVGAKLR